MTENKKPEYEGMNVYQRLRLAQSKVTFVAKDGSNPMYGKPDKNGEQKKNYVSHDAVASITRDALMSAGLIYHADAEDFDYAEKWVRFTYTFTNCDVPTEQHRFKSPPFPIDGKIQSIGAMMSYAKKYGLLNALLLPTGEDSDQPKTEPEYQQKGTAPKEKQQETKTAKSVILGDIKKTRIELGIEPDQVTSIARAVIHKDPMDATPDELQSLLDNLRARLQAQNIVKGE